MVAQSAPRLSWIVLVALIAVLWTEERADADVMLVAGSEVVLAGTVVELPIQLVAIGVSPGETIQVAGIELDVSWDPGVLYLQDVRQEEALQLWLGAENLERARARIAFASPDGLAVGVEAIHIATLRFLTSPQPGETEVALEPIPVRTATLESVPTTTGSGIVQTVGTVSSEGQSIGTLKAIYRVADD
jgi:hypothetical protein